VIFGLKIEIFLDSLLRSKARRIQILNGQKKVELTMANSCIFLYLLKD
jgi:hypothetical protein